MPVHEGFTDLLSQEDYLVKVLGHLIDSGLHECRRVCRMWYEVCNRLPVKLRLNEDGNTAAVLDKFPNAVSLEVQGSGASGNDGYVDERLAPCVSSLSSLTHLALMRPVQWPFFLAKLEPDSASWQSLLSFSAKLPNGPVYSDFLAVLRFLTGLTALKIEGPSTAAVRLEPITEIRNLKALSVGPRFLTSRDGQLIFDASTRLTRLDVLSVQEFAEFDMTLLQVIRPYAFTLRSLTLCGTHERRLVMNDWSILKSFSHLRKLLLRDIAVKTDSFWFTLVDLSLTKLAVVDVVFSTSVPLLGVICLLTSVNALELRPISRKPLSIPCCIMPPLCNLTQLTRLSLEISASLTWLTSMRKMIHLDIRTRHAASQENLLQVTENMPHLQSLKIENRHGACYIPSCMFLATERLRSLSLTGVSVDLILYEALAELRHLTELRLQCHAGTKAASSYRLHAKANLLRSLKCLRLDICHPYRTFLLESLSGASLNRLQMLELPQCELNDNQMKRLFSKFPSLRRFSSC